MYLFLVIELAAEQTAEHAQAYGVGLADAGLGGEQKIDLTQQDTANYGQHQPDYHDCYVIGGACADGLVYEAAAEPHHKQAQGYLGGACYDADCCVPADSLRVTPYPACIFHSITPSLVQLSRVSFTSVRA